MTRPRFSVVIPTYERRELALAAVRAIDAQRGAPDFDITVVVDGSRDGTAAALRALRVDRLRVIEQPNRGAAAARNAGAAASTGEILLFLDDDMEAAPDLLGVHDAEHRRGADVVLGHLPLHTASRPTVVSRAVADWVADRRDRLAAGGALELHDLLTGQLSIARDVFEAVGGFDLDFTHDGSFGGEDLDFGHRLRRAGRAIVFAPDAISHQRYVVTGTQYLRQWRQAGWSDAALERKHPELAPELPPSNPPGTIARTIAAAASLGSPGAALMRVVAGIAARLIDTGRDHPWIARIVFGARDVAYAHGRAEAARGSVAVLAFHAIGDLGDDPVLGPYALPPDAFTELLEHLARRYQVIDLERLLAGLDGRTPLPRRGVLLSFDDGYADLASIVAPAIRSRRIRAVAFAVTGMLGRTNAWDEAHGAATLPLLAADDLRALTPDPLSIGAHSRTHPELPALSDAALADEVSGARHDLRAAGLPDPVAFCFPYGEADPRVVDAVRAAGYRAAFSLDHGVVHTGADPLRLPRLEIQRGETPLLLSARLAAARRGRRLPGSVERVLRRG